MPKRTYTVTSTIMHGRRFEIGDPITLSDEEAKRLSGYVDLNSKREADPTAVPGAVKATTTSQDVDLQARIVALQAENEELKGELGESNSRLANLSSDLDELTSEHDSLKAENEQLKAAAAKPAAKGAK